MEQINAEIKQTGVYIENADLDVLVWIAECGEYHAFYWHESGLADSLTYMPFWC